MALTAARISRPLVNGKKSQPLAVEQNIFRPVAVVNIEVEHGNFFEPARLRLECRNGDIVQVTKSHGLIFGGVMTRRTDEAEDNFARGGQPLSMQGASDRSPGVLRNAGMRGRVGVKILRLRKRFEMASSVGSKQCLVRDDAGSEPINRQKGLA